ncbi:MAG: DUF4156 domain-containing protein [Gammaproteobacteria bacterium]
MRKELSMVLISVLVVSCTWVKLDKAAEGVSVRQPSDVADCKKVARTVVSLRSKVMGVKRDDEKVKKELETLARNAAVDYKGNVVVPGSTIDEGKQSFDVYQCP